MFVEGRTRRVIGGSFRWNARWLSAQC